MSVFVVIFVSSSVYFSTGYIYIIQQHCDTCVMGGGSSSVYFSTSSRVHVMGGGSTMSSYSMNSSVRTGTGRWWRVEGGGGVQLHSTFPNPARLARNSSRRNHESPHIQYIPVPPEAIARV